MSEYPWVEHPLSVGERVAVAGLPGGGAPLGDVLSVNTKNVRVKMCAAAYGTVSVARDRVDPIDWRCSQTTIARDNASGFELRVDKNHTYWLWGMRPHHTIVRTVAVDECTADLARLARERVPWVECPCTVGDAIAKPQYAEGTS